MAILNPCNHFNAMKQDLLKLLQALNFGAKGGSDLAQSSRAKAELPQGAGTDRVSPFDTASLSNLPAASLHAGSKLTPSIYAPSESAGRPGKAGEKVGMLHKIVRF